MNDIIKDEVQRIISDFDDPVKRRGHVNKLNGKMKFALDPVAYAEDAIVCIEDQIKTTVSKNKKAKLERKLLDWQKALETLRSE